jgi:hypothetical protein
MKITSGAAADVANTDVTTKAANRGNKLRFTSPTSISVSVCEKDFLTGDYSRRVSDCWIANDAAAPRQCREISTN